MPTLDDDDMADTQRELQQYLQSHAIDALFARLVEELLLERPTNPVGFIAQYLLSHYPVECAGITSHAADARGGAPRDSERAQARALLMPDSPRAADESDEDDSGSEDDTGEDYADEVSAVALRRTQERTRRANVFSETVDPHEVRPPAAHAVPLSVALRSVPHQARNEAVQDGGAHEGGAQGTGGSCPHHDLPGADHVRTPISTR